MNYNILLLYLSSLNMYIYTYTINRNKRFCLYLSCSLTGKQLQQLYISRILRLNNNYNICHYIYIYITVCVQMWLMGRGRQISEQYNSMIYRRDSDMIYYYRFSDITRTVYIGWFIFKLVSPCIFCLNTFPRNFFRLHLFPRKPQQLW